MNSLVRTLRHFLFLSFTTALVVGAVGARAETKTPEARAAAESAGATPYTREQLLAGLSRAIASHLNLDGDLQIELIRPFPLPAVVATAWDLSVTDLPSVPSGTLMVRCRLAADGVIAADATVVVRAQLWRDVWATRQPITVGSTFDATMLETRRVDVLRERDTLPASVGDKSFIFARAVPAGRLMTWRDVARRPLVRKGEVVEASAVDGPLVVTLKALAMENGARGETITVRNPESRKTFAALVVDENRVQIRF